MADAAPYEVEDAAYPFTIREKDWNHYATYRPVYPSSMGDTWLKHHGKHGGLLSSAHDIGAGSGIAAAALSRYFSHVHVSDPGESNVMTARRLLKPPSKFSFAQKPAEVHWLQDESVDFACICIAIHWMDSEQVLENVARSLRPGGTLVICSYSFLVNFPDCRQLEALWAETMRSSVKAFIDRGCLPAEFVKGMRNFLVGLDGVSVPPNLFCDVTRLHINVTRTESKPFCFVPEGQVQLPKSRVARGEHVRHLHDDQWRMEVDLPWLKGFLVSSSMPFGDETWATPAWRELEQLIIHDLNGKVVVEWPVAMVLATRIAQT